jgi:hypothetical protein
VRPYRRPAPPPRPEPPEDPDEDEALDDRPLLWFLLVAGLTRAGVALALHQPWGAEPTVLFFLALLAGVGLWRSRGTRR